jgi:hypothetical protein
MTEAAFIGRSVVSRYFFGFAIDLGQLTTTLLTINKHWAPVVFHGRTPIVSVVSYLDSIVARGYGEVNKVWGKNQG